MCVVVAIEVVPYDLIWPEIFARVSGELRSALADVDVVAIEHVGSTAVPGLAAKPVIDIDIVVAAEAVSPAIGVLENLGYGYRGMNGVLDRHALATPPGVQPRRHVYVVVAGSLALRNHLTVRSVLSQNEELRDRYSETKIRMANEARDAEHYVASKSEIIDETLAEGGLSERERASINLANAAPHARRVADDAVVTDDGARLWVEESGPVDGARVVLCHGGPGLADYMERLRNILIESGMRVIRWDQRGAGRSDRAGPYSVERFVADLESVRRTVASGPCWLVGHSWGACLALAHAQLHGHALKGVVYMCGTGLEWWPEHTRRHKQRQVERLGPQLGARLIELRDKTRSPEEDEEYQFLYLRSELADPDNVELAGAIFQAEHQFPVNHAVNAVINEELKRWDLPLQKSRCRAITVPVAVVSGDADPRPYEAVDSLVEALPTATRVPIEDSGHWPWLEQPEPTSRLLTGIMEGGAG